MPDQIDRLIQSNEASANRIVDASTRGNDLLSEAGISAARAVLTTAETTASIRWLTFVSVALSLAMLTLAAVFAIAFWRYAIVVQVP